MLSSFYTKLSLIFLVLIVALGAAVALVTVRSFDRFADETEQKLNTPLATSLSERLEPLLEDGIPDEAVEAELSRIRTVNPRIDVYLLDSAGVVLAQYLMPDRQPIEDAAVDMDPLHSFLSGVVPPILGTDPAAPGRPKPFSAAPVTIMGKPGYVYVILAGAQFDSVVGMVRGSYILTAAARALGISLVVTGLVGVLLFGLVTRRLRAVTSSVSRFADGRYEERVDDDSSDELGQLSASFNQMAETIVAHLKALERLDGQRRELVANVSHDLRSPLSSIKGYLETIAMKRNRLTPEEIHTYLEGVSRNAESLSRLVDELFELSKLDAEQVPLRLEQFSASELVQDLVLKFGATAQARGVSIRADLDSELHLVVADISLIERALSNILGNAIAFTSDGGTVTVSTAAVDHDVEISITDTGPGIPEEEHENIFERFYRVDKSRSRNSGGAGLGLAIAQRIVELHGQAIRVRSRVGEGSTFSFRLPTNGTELASE